MIPSFRAGSVMIGIVGGEHVVHATSSSWQWPPMAKASTAAIHGFSMPRPCDVVGQRLRRRDAAEELVDVADVARDEPDERDLAAIEMGEVDAGAEDVAVAIFRMLDLAAAEHGDVARAVEDGDVDGNLRPREGRVVLGVEEARVGRGEVHRLALPLEPGRTEIEHAVVRRTREAASALSGRGKSMAWQRCEPACSLASTWARKMPWSISTPSLSRWSSAASAATSSRRRREAGNGRGRGVDQVLDPDEAGPPGGELVIDRLGMGGEEALAGRARAADGSAPAAAASAAFRFGFGGRRREERATDRAQNAT